jgi:hypothetical protein
MDSKMGHWKENKMGYLMDVHMVDMMADLLASKKAAKLVIA